jgi:hypothetical protein
MAHRYLLKRVGHRNPRPTIACVKKNKNDADDMFVVTFMGAPSPRKRGFGTGNRVPDSVTYFISQKTREIL